MALSYGLALDILIISQCVHNNYSRFIIIAGGALVARIHSTLIHHHARLCFIIMFQQTNLFVLIHQSFQNIGIAVTVSDTHTYYVQAAPRLSTCES